MSTAIQQYEPVPTPRQFVGEVYALLARLMGTTPPEIIDEAGVPDDDSGPVTTDEALIRRIYEESHEAHRRMLKRLAESPDKWVYGNQLAAALELAGGKKSLAGMLGALGRRSNHRYEGKRAFYSEWDHLAYEMKHMMPASVAKVIATL
ncbi:MAG: hypothetical protein ACLQBY_17890 [Solirubrobacteraceae bacterium]